MKRLILLLSFLYGLNAFAKSAELSNPISKNTLNTESLTLVIYGAAWCGVCKETKSFLKEQGILLENDGATSIKMNGVTTPLKIQYKDVDEISDNELKSKKSKYVPELHLLDKNGQLLGWNASGLRSISEFNTLLNSLANSSLDSSALNSLVYAAPELSKSVAKSCQEQVVLANAKIKKIKKDILNEYHKKHSLLDFDFNTISEGILAGDSMSDNISTPTFCMERLKLKSSESLHHLHACLQYDFSAQEINLVLKSKDDTNLLSSLVKPECRPALANKETKVRIINPQGVANHRLGAQSEIDLKNTVLELRHKIHTIENHINSLDAPQTAAPESDTAVEAQPIPGIINL